MGRRHFVHQLRPAVLFVVQPDGPPAVSAVPQAVVALPSVRGFIIDQQHIRLAAEDLRFHHGAHVLLPHVPDRQILPFLEGELRFHPQPRLGEIEIIFPAFIPEYAQQAAIQRDKIDLRPASPDIENAVGKQLSRFPADQAVGGKPHPGGGEIPAPVLVRIAATLFRGHQIASAVENDLAAEGAFHPLGMPVHGEGLRLPQEFSGPVTHVEGDLLVHGQIPGDRPPIAHPFRMRRGLLLPHGNAAPQRRLTGQAVPRLDPIGRFSMQAHVLPGKEPVQLAMILSPGTRLDHQIRGAFPLPPVFRKLAQHRLLFRQSGIAEKEFNEKGLVFPGLHVLRREGMPPPVIAPAGQRAPQHTGVPGDIVSVEHFYFPYRSAKKR